MRSIRVFLLIALLSTITLVNFLAALHGYRASMTEAQELFDRQIAATARLIIAMPVPLDTPVVVEHAEQMAFQVWRSDGTRVLVSDNAPAGPMAPFEEGFRERNFSGFRWRIYSHFAADRDSWIQVAERVDLRYQLADKVVLESVLPILLGLPIAALLIWLVIGRGLSSLRGLAAALQRKRAEDLSPLQMGDLPEELQPVVLSTNALLARLQASFERERRFSADAAHELRTPISAIQVHAHNLESELQDKVRQHRLAQSPESLEKLQVSVARMAHLVEQMLDLFRTTPEHYPARFEMIELQSLARSIIAEHYTDFAGKNQQVELNGSEVTVRGDRFALGLLLKNLLSNANKYTPAEGRIELTTGFEKGRAYLRVDDSGPGIPESEYLRIFERFYRIGGDRHESGATGCGLGLSIVQHIADLHDAEVSLGSSKFGRGLAVTVHFPAMEESEGELEDA